MVGTNYNLELQPTCRMKNIYCIIYLTYITKRSAYRAKYFFIELKYQYFKERFGNLCMGGYCQFSNKKNATKTCSYLNNL